MDLGYGTGFVTSAISKKYTKYGLEVGKESHEFAKKYFDHMYLGELKDKTYPENYFDVIMFHTTEHYKSHRDIRNYKKILAGWSCINWHSKF